MPPRRTRHDTRRLVPPAAPMALQPVPAGIEQCPGLRPGGVFIDCTGRQHDLARVRRLRPKEAAADPRLQGLSTAAIRTLIRRGELYPVLRRNARVLELFECAIGDWWARQTFQPIIRSA